MSDVQFPRMRSEVVIALAALSDPEYQERVWMGGVQPDGSFDDLSQNIHILYDDCRVLPDPEKVLGSVLLDGPEVTRLRLLQAELGPMLGQLGDSSDRAYLEDSRWPGVRRAAASALFAMILSTTKWDNELE